MVISNKTKIDNVNLSVYIVNADWKLLRVINTHATLYRGAIDAPTITIDDNMICNLINRKEIPFYSPEQGRFNFYCNDLLAISNEKYPVNDNIVIEVLEVGEKYVLLSPGLWFGAGVNRRRMCDDGELYEIAGVVAQNFKDGDDFINEFFNIYRASLMAKEMMNSKEEVSDNKVDDTVTEVPDVIADDESDSVIDDNNDNDTFNSTTEDVSESTD